MKNKRLSRFCQLNWLIVTLFVALWVSAPLAQDSIFFSENFDSYTTGAFPTGWTLRYAGAGGVNQYVDNTYSVSAYQSLHLVGSPCWSANAYHPVAPLADTPSTVTLEAKVFVDKIVSGGCSPTLADVGLMNPAQSTWGTMYGAVYFNRDGNIYAVRSNEDRSLDVKLMPFSPKTWYNIRTDVDLTEKVFDVYIDGVLKASRIEIFDGGLPSGVEVIAGHGASPTAWFDDILISPLKPENRLSIRPDKGGNAGTVTATLFSSVGSAKFEDGTTVKLVRSGEPDIVGNPTKFEADGFNLVTTFDLTSKTPGEYVVVVTKPDVSTVTLDKPFVIEPGGSPRLWFDVLGPPQVRSAQSVSYTLIFGNSGNIDWHGLGVMGFYVPSLINNVSIRVGQLQLGSFIPKPDFKEPDMNLVSILNLLKIPPSGVGGYTAEIPIPPTIGKLGSIKIVPRLVAPEDIGNFLYVLQATKANERGLNWPELDEVFVEAFKQNLQASGLSFFTEFAFDTLKKAELAKFPDWFKEVPKKGLETLAILYPASVDAVQSIWTLLEQPENWDWTKSALMKNIEILYQPPPYLSLPDVSKLDIEVVGSIDPNSKFGARGFGDQGWTERSKPYRYPAPEQESTGRARQRPVHRDAQIRSYYRNRNPE